MNGADQGPSSSQPFLKRTSFRLSGERSCLNAHPPYHPVSRTEPVRSHNKNTRPDFLQENALLATWTPKRVLQARSDLESIQADGIGREPTPTIPPEHVIKKQSNVMFHKAFSFLPFFSFFFVCVLAVSFFVFFIFFSKPRLRQILFLSPSLSFYLCSSFSFSFSFCISASVCCVYRMYCASSC